MWLLLANAPRTANLRAMSSAARSCFVALLLLPAPSSVPAHADDHYTAALGVFANAYLDPEVAELETTANGSYARQLKSSGKAVARQTAIVTPRGEDRCRLDIVRAEHESGSSGSVAHATLDLRKVQRHAYVYINMADGRQVEVPRDDKQAALLRLEGADLYCERRVTLTRPDKAAAMQARCTSAHLVSLGDPAKRKKALAAIDTIAKACPLPP